MEFKDVPEGLTSLEYARRICEDVLGIPAKGNIPGIAEAIDVMAKNELFRNSRKPLEFAFLWMYRRVEEAKRQGQKINNLWFLNGLYWEVEKEQPVKNTERCDSICRARHGKGYHLNDMKWLLKKSEIQMRMNAPNDPKPVDFEALLSELDSKREGGPPEWRKGTQ